MNKVLRWILFLAVCGSATAASAAPVAELREPSPWMVAPFVVLLLAIALVPFLHKHFWETNYPTFAVGLGLITAGYYVGALHDTPRMVSSLIEYAGFMALIGSLYVIAGGIHINMTGRATPAFNTGLLAVGAVLANLIGTTGASMLLIRPFLRINRLRAAPYQVVFFIFVVGNIGGALTPIGDPPLFLGYLKGVPFFWLMESAQVWQAWLLCVGALLALFFVFDVRNNEQHAAGATAAATKNRIELTGSHNFVFLLVIIGLVFAQKADWLAGLEHWPAVGKLGHWMGWEAAKVVEAVTTLVSSALMIAVAALSYKLAKPDALRENNFSCAPVREVGFLFLGIFTTMVPALELLEKHATSLGISTPRQFFWGTGVLSSVLDNAPTYLNFFAAALGLRQLSLENQEHVARFLLDPSAARVLVAISLGAVFFGANTYIGNGPNFMVKSIAESNGAPCPGFFGYVFKYALPILIPLFVIVSLLVLR
jgi:Na+/H+ antiporter NhaD/arsenite permease-like protein